VPGRIDVHAHSMGPAYKTAIQAIGGIIRTPDWSPDLALKHMDRHGTQAGILSLSTPGTHLGDNAKARDLARRVNEETAGFIKQRPDRFGAFATLPLPDVEGACKEVAHALDNLKLDGVGVLASYEGIYLGHPSFDPVLAELDKRKAVVLIHPNNHPSVHEVRKGISDGIGNFLVEFLFDTTRAALNLLFTDALHRYPNIRWILCHAGGTLPFVAWRISDIASRQMIHSPWDTQYPSAYMARHGKSLTQEIVLKDFKRFYYETALSAGRQSLATVREVADFDHILFGSDWPYCPDDMTEDMIAATKNSGFFDEKQLAAVNRGNAVKLCPRFA
jgi:predicted TIM-barrel fold metal-dependent hydrolase